MVRRGRNIDRIVHIEAPFPATGGTTRHPGLHGARLGAALGAAYPIIAVGGGLSAARGQACRRADLVQIHTGFICKGPELVLQAARALAR